LRIFTVVGFQRGLKAVWKLAQGVGDIAGSYYLNQLLITVFLVGFGNGFYLC
jgi:hypothetical protein